MARVSAESVIDPGGGIQDRTIHRDSDQSAADTILTLSTPASSAARRIVMVTAKYSGSVTKNIVVTLNSGAGAAWDTILATIAISAGTDGTWIPDEAVYLMADDTLDAVADAGGGAVASALTIYTEEVS